MIASVWAVILHFLLYKNALDVVVMAILIIVSRRAAYAGRMTMVFAIAFISLHSFMEHHLLDIAYNPFILCVFADLSIKKEKKECMILNKR